MSRKLYNHDIYKKIFQFDGLELDCIHLYFHLIWNKSKTLSEMGQVIETRRPAHQIGRLQLAW